MIWPLRYGLILSVCGLCAACVSVRVQPLTTQALPVEARTERVAALQTEPARPHVKLARIIATSHSAGEETLRSKILDRGRKLGADAVVFGKVDVIESMGPGPLYQSTLSPAGASPYYGGWGWWNPFYLDPWSFVQGSSDQAQWTLYLSGVAIRYQQKDATEPQPSQQSGG